MPARPTTIALLGAPGTGAAALALALQQGIAPPSVQIVCATDPAKCPQADLTLLMGLDVPCPPDQRAAREAADARLRAALEHGGRAYRVVYGQGEQRLANALNAIQTIAASADPSSASGHYYSKTGNNPTKPARRRTWDCEKCSDPECEHKLFTALMDRSTGAA